MVNRSFLDYVAEDIIGKYGTDLSSITVVFPNKRASLFLDECLAKRADRPVWSPSYVTISDLFREHSDFIVADQIKLVCDLYKSFVKYTESDETLDHFYGWGQLLLSDFDDIDKNMAEASKIFMNLKNIHELDDISYLTEEQKAIIQHFFNSFNNGQDTELKKKFSNLWKHFGDIYHDFNQRLISQGIAYEGALYRKVAEDETIDFRSDKYLIVGFNMLQKVECKLFQSMKEQDKAAFYWDFDDYYMPHKGHPDNEAGHYIAQYLRDFPNELANENPDIYDNFRKPKQITFASASTENIQARYICQWLHDNNRLNDGKQTAIVMCNEALMQTALYALPPDVGHTNITLGYPLALTPAASLVTHLTELQTAGRRGRDRYHLPYVRKVLMHPWAKYISPLTDELLKELTSKGNLYPTVGTLSKDEAMGQLFARLDTVNISAEHENTESLASYNGRLLRWIMEMFRLIGTATKSSDDDLLKESAFRMYTNLSRLTDLSDKGDLDVDITTLRRLIRQITGSTTVPFHGEPAIGLQIMGVLETRNIDFRHILVLSCNEGNMPKGVNDSSFIPYSIRKAYGLTTIDNKVAIYAYYFHRMLQRAEDITLVYNNSTEGGHTGEKSRFMTQLMAESGHQIKFESLLAGHETSTAAKTSIAKDENVMTKLFGMRNMSPSAINRYIRCPKQFYYNYIKDIKEPETDEDDGIDNRVFGNIFHKAAQHIYTPFIGKQVCTNDIDRMLKDERTVEQAVEKAFREELFGFKDGDGTKTTPQYNGLQLINKEVIKGYLRRLLQLDRLLTPFTVLGLELKVSMDISIEADGRRHSIAIGGSIDRLDKVTRNGKTSVRVLDYKTGRQPSAKTKSVEDVFSSERISQKHSDYFLQAMLYSLVVRHSPEWNPGDNNVSPALLFIRHTANDDYDPVIEIGNNKVEDIETFRQDFDKGITTTLEEMYDRSVPFTPTADTSRCLTCPWAMICGL